MLKESGKLPGLREQAGVHETTQQLVKHLSFLGEGEGGGRGEEGEEGEGGGGGGGGRKESSYNRRGKNSYIRCIYALLSHPSTPIP